MFSTANKAHRRRHSLVVPAMCGARTTLSKVRRGFSGLTGSDLTSSPTSPSLVASSSSGRYACFRVSYVLCCAIVRWGALNDAGHLHAQELQEVFFRKGCLHMVLDPSNMVGRSTVHISPRCHFGEHGYILKILRQQHLADYVRRLAD